MASFSFPVVGTSLHEQADTFGAGRSGGRSHKGIDIFADMGAPVVAVRGGRVVKAGNSRIGGLRAWVIDADGDRHYYAHLSELDVRDGQRVKAGQRIGAVGDTGNAKGTPPHLHYSVNPSQTTSESGAYNPYKYLQSNGAITASSPEPSGTGGRRPGLQPGSGAQGEDVSAEDWQAAAEATGRSPEQRFVDQRQESSAVMTRIASTISEAATRDYGGKELTVSALLGSGFADEDEDVEVA